jgi:MscS family membrane protein
VRFTQFASSSLDIEIFAYVLTADYNHFADIREELLLKVMDVIQSVGASVAFPSQTLYLTKDASEALSLISEADKPDGDAR